MGKPFDVSTKRLLPLQPEDWLRRPGIDAERVEIVGTDLSTVIADADEALVLSVGGRELLDIELQSMNKSNRIGRLTEYSILYLAAANCRCEPWSYIADRGQLHRPYEQLFEVESGSELLSQRRRNDWRLRRHRTSIPRGESDPKSA